MRHHAVVLVLSGCLVLLAATPVCATKIIAMDPQELGARSVLVARGTVAGVQSYWNARHTKIFTEIAVDVTDAYKGAASGRIRLLQLGGTVGDVRVTAHGALHWTGGEDVLLFLEPGADGAYQVTGFSQGKFNVERDPRTGRAYVSRPAPADVETVAADGTAGAVPPAIDRVPLESFVADALGRERMTDDY